MAGSCHDRFAEFRRVRLIATVFLGLKHTHQSGRVDGSYAPIGKLAKLLALPCARFQFVRNGFNTSHRILHGQITEGASSCVHQCSSCIVVLSPLVGLWWAQYCGQ